MPLFCLACSTVHVGSVRFPIDAQEFRFHFRIDWEGEFALEPNDDKP